MTVMMLPGLVSHAQVTKVMGKVTDASTKEPIPFVNIIFKGGTVGNITDFEGAYSFETRKPTDSIIATYMGYERKAKKVIPNKFQYIDFELTPTNLNLPEVTVRYKGNPAEKILEKIISNKANNTLKEFDYYQYEVYSKVEIDANNITEKMKERRLFRPFSFIFNYMDTSTVNGKAFLPVFITETLSDVYYRKNPKTKREVIKASKISGLENESVTQVLGEVYMDVNVYGNFIELFEKNFVSPIADFGLGYYKYYLTDSAYIGNEWCYHISFKPKRKQELTFTGNFWVNDTTFAIKEIQMRIADDANINFINDVAIEQKFDHIDNTYWMLSKDYIIIDFNVIENSKKTMGFFAHRTTSYRNIILNQPADKKIYNLASSITVKDSSDKKSDDYWDQSRHEGLTKNEKNIYIMVDSIKHVPIFRTYVDLIYTITNGYYIWKNIELGPYFKIYSFNGVEGSRFRVGGRTSNDFSTKLMLEGHLAYGTKDERFKYGAGLMYIFNKNPRRAASASFKYDVEQLGLSQNAFTEDNILSSVFRRSPSNKLTMVREYKGSYEHEWTPGFSNTLNFIHREIYPLGSSIFEIYPSPLDTVPRTMNSIFTTELRLDTRIAYNEKLIRGEFLTYSMGSKYPILEIHYGYGIPNLLGSQYEYHRLQVNIKQWFNFGSIGWSKYIIDAGKVWGKLPYPLLKMHEGNQTFIFDESAFNLMNYYEFVSDEYVSAYYTHHFEGLLLNKIPLMRKLKWREVAFAKGVIGNVSAHNIGYSKFPDNLASLNYKPYYEAGVGIENIFRILRIDAIWRLSHFHDTGNQKPSRFSVFASLQFSF